MELFCQAIAASLFFPLLLGGTLVLILWLLLIRIVEIFQPDSTAEPDTLPRTALIVPVTGLQKGLHRNLLALLRQQYPDYRVYFVTESNNDAATPILEQLAAENRHAAVIEAGPATSCSQKNHNIIIGSRKAADAQVLVFCDSTHLAAPDWLTRLVTPLLSCRTKIISSGYHQVMVEGRDITESGRAICVLVLRLARMIPGFRQPWGGATAVLRETFLKSGIAEMWSERVVDDVTLAGHLRQLGLSVVIPRHCDLSTELSESCWANWENWLTRQWAYLKFVFPRLWFFLGCAGIVYTLALYSSLIMVLLTPFGLIDTEIQQQAVLSLALFFLFGLLLRRFHPQPGPPIIWFAALLPSLLMAGWCHARTWMTTTITWAGITYTVTKGGRVTHIERPQRS